MTPINYICIASISLLAMGCVKSSPPPLPLIPSAQLAISYQNATDSLTKARATLLFNGGQSATNCESYYDLISQNRVEESIDNQLVKSEYLTCDALKILLHSSGVSSEYNEMSSMGETLLSNLDLRSFPSSLYRKSSDEFHSLKSLYPIFTSATENVAELNTENWAMTLEVVAVSRINDNEYPDWIVWLTDESKTGNYRGYSTLIIYDPDQYDSLKASIYP